MTNETSPISLPRWILFGWLYWMLRPPVSRFWCRVAGVINVAFAGTFLGMLLYSLPARLSSIPNPETIQSIDARCDKLRKGGTYVIEVGGRRHECWGADTWCPERRPVPVTFDRQNPSHCRATATVRRFSRWEGTALLTLFTQLCGGVSLTLIRENDPNRARDIVSHGLFLLFVVLMTVSVFGDLLPY